MAKCQFPTTKYYDHESKAWVDYNCPDNEEPLGSGHCIFHNENYLQDKNNQKEHEQKVRDRLMAKVRNSMDQKEALHCIGYHLPDTTIKETFTKPVYFLYCEFQGKADFTGASFQAQVDFGSATFSGPAGYGSIVSKLNVSTSTPF